MLDFKTIMMNDARKEFSIYLSTHHTDLYYRWEGVMDVISPGTIKYLLRGDKLRGKYLASKFRRIIYDTTVKLEKEYISSLDIVKECLSC